MDIKHKYYLWNYLSMIVFSLILIVFLINADITSKTPDFFILALLMLSTYRITRLFTKDKIFEHSREVVKSKTKNSFFYTLHELLICPWCTSIWIGLFITMFYYLTPLAIPVLILLSISAVASVLQVMVTKYS